MTAPVPEIRRRLRCVGGVERYPRVWVPSDDLASILDAADEQARAVWAARVYIVGALGSLDRAGRDVIKQLDAADARWRELTGEAT